MARPAKKTSTATSRSARAKSVETKIDNIETAEEVTSEAAETPKKRVYDPEELIECKSISPGGTYVTGSKSGNMYTFEYEGAIEGIEYQDLVRMINSRSTYLFRPFIIVMDDDFVNEFPRLKEFYNTKYSMRELDKILYLRPAEIKKAIESLPIGAKDAIKGLAISKISDGSYDPSVAQTKALDEALGTQIMLVANL